MCRLVLTPLARSMLTAENKFWAWFVVKGYAPKNSRQLKPFSFLSACPQRAARSMLTAENKFWAWFVVKGYAPKNSRQLKPFSFLSACPQRAARSMLTAI